VDNDHAATWLVQVAACCPAADQASQEC